MRQRTNLFFDIACRAAEAEQTGVNLERKNAKAVSQQCKPMAQDESRTATTRPSEAFFRSR